MKRLAMIIVSLAMVVMVAGCKEKNANLTYQDVDKVIFIEKMASIDISYSEDGWSVMLTRKLPQGIVYCGDIRASAYTKTSLSAAMKCAIAKLELEERQAREWAQLEACK